MSNRTDHFFIYPKGTDGHPTGNAICVLLRDGKMYHGEAVCSDEDQFDKKIGREIAYQRAVEAADAASNKTKKEVNKKKSVWSYSCTDGTMNIYDVVESPYERNLKVTEFFYSKADPNWTMPGKLSFSVDDHGNGVTFAFSEKSEELDLSYSQLSDIFMYFMIDQKGSKFTHNVNKVSGDDE
jgi:hypothetical protein